MRKAFVKMDIEGSEYDFIRDTPESVWNRVCGLAFELHDHPLNLVPRDDFLARVEALGFRCGKEDIISYFAHRRAVGITFEPFQAFSVAAVLNDMLQSDADLD